MKKYTTFKISKFKTLDAKQIARLIIKTFSGQVGKRLPRGARQLFVQGNTPAKILKLSEASDIFVAKVNNKIIGIISGVDDNRVIRLFVYKKFQRQGIASKLMRHLEALYKKRGAKTIHIRSSLYAIDFYSAMGYKKATRLIHKKDGMVYQPMIKYF